MNFESRINLLNQFLRESNKTVFFWWAGVSTESGVPDFRSKNWLYNQHDVKFDHYQPEYLLSHSCLYDEPTVFYEYYRQKLDCRWIKPNITHIRLAQMEENWKLSSVITQNIDWLHQKAWSKNVIEIHWTTQCVYCDKCRKLFNPDIIFTDSRPIPLCDCWWMIRPDVTLYWEQLPWLARNLAVQEISQADLFIIGWTSLVVYPANTLLHYFHWKRLIVINKSETVQDKYADIVFHENLWKVFNYL